MNTAHIQDTLQTLFQDSARWLHSRNKSVKLSLSADRIRRILQKRGSIRNTPAAVSEDNKTLHTSNSNRQTSATLELAAQDGYVEIKYLDESGFCLWSPVGYSYSRVNEQKRLEQVPHYGTALVF